MGGMASDKHSVMQLIRSIDLDDSGTIELHEFEVRSHVQVWTMWKFIIARTSITWNCACVNTGFHS